MAPLGSLSPAPLPVPLPVRARAPVPLLVLALPGIPSTILLQDLSVLRRAAARDTRPTLLQCVVLHAAPTRRCAHLHTRALMGIRLRLPAPALLPATLPAPAPLLETLLAPTAPTATTALGIPLDIRAASAPRRPGRQPTIPTPSPLTTTTSRLPAALPEALARHPLLLHLAVARDLAAPSATVAPALAQVGSLAVLPLPARSSVDHPHLHKAVALALARPLLPGRTDLLAPRGLARPRW